MPLDARFRAGLKLPAICAPMFLVSGPDLVREACLAGVVGALPRPNARTVEEFGSWLASIRVSLDDAVETGRTVAPLAVNFPAKFDRHELDESLRLCEKYGVDTVISVNGNPAEITKRVHDWGGRIFHDVTSLRFAEKAISGGVDGLVCIGSGGGGHSGTVSHLALIPAVRAIFDGVIVAAGAITTGAAIRAAEILGADLTYLGTRFIATQESMAHAEHKQMILDAGTASLRYMAARGGVPANWLESSLARAGVDLAAIDEARRNSQEVLLPTELKYWKDVWSAGQGVDLIHDIPTVSELVTRLRCEYVAACEKPDMSGAARLVDQALDAG